MLMTRFLLTLLLLPLLTHAQQPKMPLQLKKTYPSQYQVKKIRVRKGILTIVPAKTKWLSIGGNYTFSAAASSVNTRPSLQNQYAQGESSNGSLVWLGPETNEVFSYGPSLPNGIIPYNNNIFRRGSTIAQSLSFRATIRNEYWKPLWAFSLKAGNTTENTVIPDNRNTTHSIAMSAERRLESFLIAGSYSAFSSRFSNDNSNGFLNRVYQNALQTPISFNNAQSPTLITGGQRAYSNQADNPWFLLKDNGHFADRSQQTGNVSLQKDQGNIIFGVISTLDAVHDNSNQSLKPGTAFFPTGLAYTRTQQDDHFSSDAYLAYKHCYISGRFTSKARLN